MSAQIRVEILAIGNELLRGEILDTNTQWICQMVHHRGGQVVRVSLLPDIEAEIAGAVRMAIERGADLVFTSGGLGPTDDDLTLTAVAKGAGVELALDAQAREMVRHSYDAFHARGVLAEGGLNPFREKMAWLPVGSTPLFNPVGTAPGVLLQVGKTAIVALPGVPPELKGIIEKTMGPWLSGLFGSGGAFARSLIVRCNDESIMVPALTRVVERYPQVYIKSLAQALGGEPELEIFFTATSSKIEEREQWVNSAVAELQQSLTELGIAHREKG